MDWRDRLLEFWPHIAAAFTVLIALLTSSHAILHKRDSRAAVLWIGVIWLVPLLGSILYWLLGVNRVRRMAAYLRGSANRPVAPIESIADPLDTEIVARQPDFAHLKQLAEAVGRVVGRPLLGGNRVEVLVNGDAAYPPMLAAINAATRSISLSTYIFDHDACGKLFVEALAGAVKRGVEVRVLVDAAGSHYSVPSVLHALHHARVPSAKFLPVLGPWRMMAMNLRNHRKILVVDGAVGFTGGINLREGNFLGHNPRHPIQDLHFRVEGPVVAQLQEAFAGDWFFAKKEMLRGNAWFPALAPKGSVVARAIPDGPDEDFEKLRWTILAALACARKSVRIMTPYFLPDTAIISALNLAALRGVAVDIVLPGKNNLPYIHWASRALWWQVLKHECRVWLTPPPFDHSKLMLVDEQWSLVGSGNWDPRSLRLNFEFNLESYDGGLARSLELLVQSKMKNAREVTLAEVDARSLPVKLRDGVARLLTPFL
jgi:cardiolipin synthase